MSCGSQPLVGVACDCNSWMNCWAVSLSLRSRRWMIPSGRTSGWPSSGTCTSVPDSISRAIVGSGNKLMPAPISIARLIVSMLSNSSAIARLHFVQRQRAVDFFANLESGLKRDERLAAQHRRAARCGAA